MEQVRLLIECQQSAWCCTEPGAKASHCPKKWEVRRDRSDPAQGCRVPEGEGAELCSFYGDVFVLVNKCTVSSRKYLCLRFGPFCVGLFVNRKETVVFKNIILGVN